MTAGRCALEVTMRVRCCLLVLAALAGVGAAAAQQPSPPPAKPTAPRPRATPAPPTIEGLVRGPDRKAIDKALVMAMAESQRLDRRFGSGESPVSTRTDADGRFRLVLRKPHTQTVRVEASGLAAHVRKGVSPGASLTIDLTRGGAIEGVVRDGDSGQPVARARVEAWGRNTIGLPDDPDAGRIVTTTDAEGRFKLEGLAAGLHTVSARSRMAGFATRANVRVGTRVELLVFPAATVSGTVTGPDGKPVPRAVVSAAGRPFGRGSTKEAADDLGRYELNGLDPGVYDVIARAPGMAPGVAPEVALDRRGDARVDLTLRPGARVVGRLVDASERPVAGRVTVGELDGRATPFALADSLRGEAPADGRFAIEAVPAGEHALGVSAPGQAPQRVEFAVRAGDRQVDLGEVRLEVGLAIRGRVRTKAGAPVADASVRGFAMRRGSTQAEAVTEADGSFVLAGLEQTVYRLTVQAHGFGTANKEAEPGGDPLDLVLEPAGIITGQVVDDRGKPLETFRVTARGAESPMMRRMPRFEEVTSDDGRFSLDDVAAGSYEVNVTAPERAPGTVPGVTVAAGGGVDVGTIKLGAGGVVHGTVVESGGGPISGARVSVKGQGRDWISFGTDPEATTDGSGAFEVKGVSAGTAQVSASHPSYARAEPVSAEVDLAQGPADVRIVLTQGGRVEGSVRRRDGTPLAGQMVAVSTGGGMTFAPFGRDSSATTGPDGRFAIENVLAGRGRLTVLVAGTGGAMQSGLSRDVEVREGETTTVDVVLREILVSGQVTRAGAPAAGLRIEAQAQSQFMFGGMPSATPPAASSGPQRMRAVTREDGSYEMIVDQPGSMTVNVMSGDGRLRLPWRKVEIPDADAFTLDLAFAGVAVTGIVVDEETEAPIGYANVGARPRAPEASYRGGGGTSGPDGRFQIEVEPGDHVVSAATHEGDYGHAELAVRVGESGLSEVRLALPKGLAISGRVTDAAGRAVSAIDVNAVPADEYSGVWGSNQSLADGSFNVTGLNQGTYTVVAQSDAGTFALRSAIAAPTKNVSLVLQPGGRIAVKAEGPSAEPVAGAWPVVTHVNGVPVGGLGRALARTDAQGATELLAPPGNLTVRVRKDNLRGTATVDLAPGGSASVTVRLEESAPAR